MENYSGSSEQIPAGAQFTTTHWTVVLAAKGFPAKRQAAAMEQLCRTYWHPLYSYIRHRGNAPEDAQDLTQEFFARLLDKQWLENVEKNGSRFRSFLLTALNRFLANQHDRAQAAKRGGGQQIISLDVEEAERRYLQEPASSAPEQIFDRRWALTVLDRAFTRLKDETMATGKARQFEVLNPFLSSEPEPGEYAAAATDLQSSNGTIGVLVHRLRARYRELVRAEISETLADPSQLETEMVELFSALRG